MTTKVFTGWVRALHLKMYGRKNLLLIDNAPGHADIELKTSTSTFCPRIRLPIYNQWMLALFGISNSSTKKTICAVGRESMRLRKAIRLTELD